MSRTSRRRAVQCAWLLALAVAFTACANDQRSRFEALSNAWRTSAPGAERAGGRAPAPGPRRSLPGLPDAGAGDRAAEVERAHPLRTDVHETDPFAESARLERDALVQQVLARNPSVRAARYAWRAALARYPQATALDDPMLGVGAAPLSFGSDVVDDAWRFELAQRLPAPGTLRLRGEAALGEAEAAAHDMTAVRLRLATMASLLFDDYRFAQRALAINAQHIELLEEFRQIATARYEVGEAAQQDPIQAEVELTHAHHRSLLLETAYRVAAEQMNALLHRRAQAPLPPPAEPASLALPEPVDAEELVREALEANPELEAATARIAAQQARVGLAWRAFLPDVTLGGAYNGVMQEEDLQPFVGIQLAVPLQIGRRRAAVAEASAGLEQARSELAALEDEVRAGVQTSALRAGEAIHVVRLFRDRLVPAARDQVEAARSGFETGRNSFLALIDAERNLLDVELGLEEAIANLNRRRAELARAVGRIAALAE